MEARMDAWKERGFTMAELLIVVAIIAVLAAIAIPIFTNQLEKSREGTDADTIRNAYAKAAVKALDAQSGDTIPNVEIDDGDNGLIRVTEGPITFEQDEGKWSQINSFKIANLQITKGSTAPTKENGKQYAIEYGFQGEDLKQIKIANYVNETNKLGDSVLVTYTTTS